MSDAARLARRKAHLGTIVAGRLEEAHFKPAARKLWDAQLSFLSRRLAS